MPPSFLCYNKKIACLHVAVTQEAAPRGVSRVTFFEGYFGIYSMLEALSGGCLRGVDRALYEENGGIGYEKWVFRTPQGEGNNFRDDEFSRQIY